MRTTTGLPPLPLPDRLSLPYSDPSFGAATCLHVLEHMRSIADAAKAISELERVAERVFILVPSRSLRATFPEDHYLWLDWQGNGYLVTDRATGEQQTLTVRDLQTPTR